MQESQRKIPRIGKWLTIVVLTSTMPSCITWYTGKPDQTTTLDNKEEFHFSVTSYGEAGVGAIAKADVAVAEMLRKFGYTRAVQEKSRLDYQNKGGRAPFVEVACSQSHVVRWQSASAYWALTSLGTLGIIPHFGSQDLQIDVALYHFDAAKGSFVAKRIRSYNMKGYRFSGILALPVFWVSWIADGEKEVVRRAVLDFLQEPLI